MLLGINVREIGVDNARAFQRDVGVDFPSFYDPGSEVLLAFERFVAVRDPEHRDPRPRGPGGGPGDR